MKKEVKEAPSKDDPDADHFIPFWYVVAALSTMVFSHIILYYLFVSLYMYDGALFNPVINWDKHVLFAQKNFVPTRETWTVYLGFITMEAVFAYVLPGVQAEGFALKSLKGKKLTYLCNGYTSWYATKVAVAALHFSGVLPASWAAENILPLVSTMIIFGDILAVIVYVGSFYFQITLRMSGSHIYDFFMGASLNPRIGILDIKMWAETRVSWITLFFLTFSAACEQYRQLGYVTGPMLFMCTTHWLYSNACHKGEELIPMSYDIFYEKYGWMLCFWNLAGVPLMYSWNSFYILKNPHNPGHVYLVVIFITLFITYWIWDTSNSQKCVMRAMEHGKYSERHWLVQPQFSNKYLTNPKVLQTKHGNKILVDGWLRYARKLHYTCDIIFALLWGLACGQNHFLPYWYFVFFTSFIIHRAIRDNERCKEKYGADWDTYTKTVPYVFIPYII